jgi:hypothetical protein
MLRFALCAVLLVGCSDGTEADRLGVGAACGTSSQCQEGQECLTQFKGGYCGIVGCASDATCPSPSVCVAHTDGKNYCFRDCVDKTECNAKRPVELEANCSSSITLVSGQKGKKVCVPPSGS